MHYISNHTVQHKKKKKSVDSYQQSFDNWWTQDYFIMHKWKGTQFSACFYFVFILIKWTSCKQRQLPNGLTQTDGSIFYHKYRRKLYTILPSQRTLGAAIGYSSGKNSSNLKTPPVIKISDKEILILSGKSTELRKQEKRSKKWRT